MWNKLLQLLNFPYIRAEAKVFHVSSVVLEVHRLWENLVFINILKINDKGRSSHYVGFKLVSATQSAGSFIYTDNASLKKFLALVVTLMNFN